jgi:GH15 family glucan-1,4-alpha-glucosidase
MSLKIEDYALIGDCQTAALVSREGSIDWLCLPRFDSEACFAALLGTEQNGRWKIAPKGEVTRTRRTYRGDTLVLETEFETESGTVALIDCMPPRDETPDVVRVVEGRKGEVPMRMDLTIRYDYGSLIPWVRRGEEGHLWAIAGPDMLRLRTEVEHRGENKHTVAEFTVKEGQRVHFDLSWFPSHRPAPPEMDMTAAVEETESWWEDWASKCTYDGEYRDAVLRSLITLKALNYLPTGGIVAAPTTSLPELIGGVRNWDYRYCWLRDSTFTLYALIMHGYREEAAAWREWLLRAVAGEPSKLQIMYGIAGERRLREYTLDWLPGYEGSKPVRVGNAAWDQFQLDVFGEVMDTLHLARRAGLEVEEAGWQLQLALLEFLEDAWKRPDEGIWEIRGPRQHFTHSKMMAWVAFDRAIRDAENFNLDGPVRGWKSIRAEIHDQVVREGFNEKLGAFVQFFGSTQLDASLLMMPLVGFLPADDPRVLGTVKAIERDLVVDDFVLRYRTESEVDALPAGEGAFLPCTFWLVDNYALQGRLDEAHRLFRKFLSISNDVGLLAEEYDPHLGRQLGNFPQAFSHIGLINSARNLARGGGPARHRQEG